jgi:hypothetical protein
MGRGYEDRDKRKEDSKKESGRRKGMGFGEFHDQEDNNNKIHY